MPVDPQLWKEVWDACPWATIFASPLWHAVTEEIEPLDASFEWKGIITPLRKIKLAKGLLKGYESTIPGVACGPITERVLESSKIEAYWNELNQRTRGRFLVHLRVDSPFKNTSFKRIEIISRVLKIKDKQARISAHHRRQLRKAEDTGIVVTPARRDEDFEAYLEMYESSLRRWKRRPARTYSKDFFERIREYILPAERGSFFIAWKKGRPQSGALVFFEKRRAIYWHGANTDDPSAGAGHLLHWRIMEEAGKRGIEEYEFGPSAGLEGVERFKEGFGAEVEIQITVVGPSAIFSSYLMTRLRR